MMHLPSTSNSPSSAQAAAAQSNGQDASALYHRNGKREPYVALIVAILLSIVFASISAWNRIPWSDEGHFSSACYNLAYRGFMGTTVLEPTSMNLPGINAHTY